jgi:hypothetical protein
MHSVRPVHNPKKTLFQNITNDNYFLSLRCNGLLKLVSDLESNVEQLNGFIRSSYDVSSNLLTNIKLITFDSSDNIIACIHSDLSGNFVACNDLSDNYLPCVINPTAKIMKTSKTHISDMSKGHPLYNPYYPYYPNYPPYYSPYYPSYYPGLFDNDDHFYNYIDASSNNGFVPNPHLPPHPITRPPKFSKLGTHIHIHNS